MSERAKVGDWIRSKSTPPVVAQVVFYCPAYVFVEDAGGHYWGKDLNDYHLTNTFKSEKSYKAVFKYDVIPTPSLLLEDLL